MDESVIEIDGQRIPVRAVNTVIVGAGAAGMNCAVQLVQQWRAVGVDSPQDKVLVVTGGLALGASRMSGSDKQTYYKMGTSPRMPDTAADFAATLTAFGCCHGDNALIEGICSLRGFYHLVEVGVPFPRDPHGAFIGYKTDHDPHERATSAGPKTSRFMSECLQAKAEHLGVQIIDKQVVADFITEGRGPEKRIAAMVCIDSSRAGGDDLGLSAFVAENWVLAAGGSGEIYKATVYPPGQVGIHGAALKAGLVAANLTESQYGLASVKFRWNVSGTYMQVAPRIFSTDLRGGDEREFLTEYFDDMSTMATNIFLKGYQWPFDAQRITDHQSSLIDMAVHQETVVRGRRVWMDFLRNPIGPSAAGPGSEVAGGWDEFKIGALGSEALEYLRKTGAMQELPIDRLAHMNQPAIDIYAENGIDLRAEPLEIAVCAQHMNGGFAVDKWWRSSVGRTFVIGEMAGTHGVKRPGGSALNAGQVGAMRASEYIANAGSGRMPDAEQPAVQQGLAAAARRLRSMLVKDAAGVTPAEAMDEIRDRMTRYGAHLRSRAGASDALKAAKEQYARLLDRGLKVSGPDQLVAAVQAVQQCLTHVAVLKAICAMFERGAGSRGSHCILDESGVEMHPALIDPGSGRPYRFEQENESLRNEILQLTHDPGAPDLFGVDIVEPRAVPDRDIAFEVAWSQFRGGKIYEL